MTEIKEAFPLEKAKVLHKKILPLVDVYMKHKTRSNWTKVEKVIVQFIIDNFPGVHGSNTEVFLKVLEYQSVIIGEPLTENVRKMIRRYKPEAITRLRRGIILSTKAQKEEEERYREDARKGVFNRITL